MLKKIGKENITIAYEYIKSNCDSLYRSLFEYHVLSDNQCNVVDKLRTYQNEDGGFGHGLEPDFLLEKSSPMATTIAFQVFRDIKHLDHEIIQRAIAYYDTTFDNKRSGWWSVPPEINDYPHAPWWEYDEQKQGTVIDIHWGNPSSEIIGTLYTWKDYSRLDVKTLVENAVAYLNNLTEFTSEHELYCYLRMYEQLSFEFQKQLKDKLSQGIKALICLDEGKWNTYVPKPLDFIQSKTHPLFHEIEDYVDMHCDFMVKTIENGVWHPTWRWGQYESYWEKSQKNWTAILTIKNYRILKEFDRME